MLLNLLYGDKNIMISMLFTFQIILLVIGLGVGYLFLVKASTQDSRLKNIGEIIGWTLIAATIFLAICNFFYSITMLNNYTGTKSCPVSSTSETQEQAIQEGNTPEVPQENSQDNQNLQDNENSQDNQNKPIKRDIHDHE